MTPREGKSGGRPVVCTSRFDLHKMPIQVISGIFCGTLFRGFGIDKLAYWTHLGGGATDSTCPMPSRVSEHLRAETSRKRQRPERAIPLCFHTSSYSVCDIESPRIANPCCPQATAFAKPQTAPPEPPHRGNVEKQDLNVCHCWLVQQCNARRACDLIPQSLRQSGHHQI